jgi:uncharacterized short protein YbdD (DUF466 family)
MTLRTIFRRGAPMCASMPLSASEGQMHRSALPHVAHTSLARIEYWLKQCVANLRHLSGDDAYERYLIHHQQHHADQAILDRRTFYLAETQRKWTGVKRCC